LPSQFLYKLRRNVYIPANVWNFIPGNEILCRGLEFSTWICHFRPGFDILYQGLTCFTRIWHFLRRFEILYHGMKFWMYPDARLPYVPFTIW
jgi:hypothetical protein